VGIGVVLGRKLSDEQDRVGVSRATVIDSGESERPEIKVLSGTE
jgi:hypothetical protein